MKDKIALTLIGLMLALGMLACELTVGSFGGQSVRGSGTVVEQSRSIGDISGVELTIEGTLHIEMGSSESLSIEAEDNLLEYIQTDERAGKLVIRTSPGYNLRPTRPINYYLTVDELDSIGTFSSGDVEAGDLQADSLSTTTSSSGSISIGRLGCTSLQAQISSSGDVVVTDLMADSINVRITSSGSLEILGGQVDQQNITLSSSGEYRANDLASLEADVTLTSNGSATIRVSDRLSGRLSSSGDIYYIGNPTVDVSTSSSGKVVQINE